MSASLGCLNAQVDSTHEGSAISGKVSVLTSFQMDKLPRMKLKSSTAHAQFFWQVRYLGLALVSFFAAL